jgi:hypothetical protein
VLRAKVEMFVGLYRKSRRPGHARLLADQVRDLRIAVNALAGAENVHR